MSTQEQQARDEQFRTLCPDGTPHWWEPLSRETIMAYRELATERELGQARVCSKCHMNKVD